MRFTEEQITYALRQAEGGTPVADVCRQLGSARPVAWLSSLGRPLTGRARRRTRRHFGYQRKPMDNGHIESFNGRLRDECLNVNQFLSTASREAAPYDAPNRELAHGRYLSHSVDSGKVHLVHKREPA